MAEHLKIANLVKLVSEIIKGGDMATIDAAYIALRRVKNGREYDANPSLKKSHVSNFNHVDAEFFDKFETREEVERYLDRVATKKADLELIARQLKLPLSKREDARELVDKIVDSSVGYKLRSKAIRGKASESSGGDI
ncbi:hypothetical protein J6595_15760 [Jiella sp. KSK16Y-1]|uniref:Uncharacterized protein n=1 Tax=Jiella mangrovi TaxID=2821407 RepID=A0ABS4BLJ1_9HYPH|nr:hypothetical protein [Jiella mangrovi]